MQFLLIPTHPLSFLRCCEQWPGALSLGLREGAGRCQQEPGFAAGLRTPFPLQAEEASFYSYSGETSCRCRLYRTYIVFYHTLVSASADTVFLLCHPGDFRQLVPEGPACSPARWLRGCILHQSLRNAFKPNTLAEGFPITFFCLFFHL